ncbi:MAG: hypothetical protein AB7O45_08150 [Alphaproteobacteria bacterium]
MRTILAAAFLALAAGSMPTAAAERVHGADSHFAAPGIAVGWAVLRHRDENEVKVILRVRRTDDRYSHVRVDGLDPFTKAKEGLVAPTTIGRHVDLAIPRARFADLPSIELHLSAGATAPPMLTIYYLGVPDTTPEFDAAAALAAYLDKMVGAR